MLGAVGGDRGVDERFTHEVAPPVGVEVAHGDAGRRVEPLAGLSAEVEGFNLHASVAGGESDAPRGGSGFAPRSWSAGRAQGGGQPDVVLALAEPQVAAVVVVGAHVSPHEGRHVHADAGERPAGVTERHARAARRAVLIALAAVADAHERGLMGVVRPARTRRRGPRSSGSARTCGQGAKRRRSRASGRGPRTVAARRRARRAEHRRANPPGRRRRLPRRRRVRRGPRRPHRSRRTASERWWPRRVASATCA